MSGPQDKHENFEQHNAAELTSDQGGAEHDSARRTLLKAAWVAPVIFSLAADQASAQVMTGRRR